MSLFNLTGKDKDPSHLLAKKDYEGAVKAFQKMLEKNPSDINSRLRMADALAELGEVDRAIEEYQKVAGSYAEKGFLVKAIAVNKKIVKLDPDRDDVHKKLAELDREYRGEEGQAKPSGEEKAGGEEAPAGEDVEIAMEDAGDDMIDRAKTPLFSDFSPEEFRRVAESLNHFTCPADTEIVREGDQGDSMFVIVNGEVSVRTSDPLGDEFELTALKEGDFFGEVSLLTERPRTATIKAKTPAEFLELSRDELDKLVNDHPEIWDTLNRFYEERAGNTVEAMIERMRAKRD